VIQSLHQAILEISRNSWEIRWQSQDVHRAGDKVSEACHPGS
jgi:type IV secretory pathway TrbF-like protein